MVTALQEAPRVLTRQLTVYEHAKMSALLCLVLRLKLDDALECGALAVEYNLLANGYPFFAVFIHDHLFGIVDVRGNLSKVQRHLTAYLWRFGVRADASEVVIGGARLPQSTPTWRCIDGEQVLDVWKPRDWPRLFDLD